MSVSGCGAFFVDAGRRDLHPRTCDFSSFLLEAVRPLLLLAHEHRSQEEGFVYELQTFLRDEVATVTEAASIAPLVVVPRHDLHHVSKSDGVDRREDG